MLDGIIHNIKEYYKHGEGKGSPNGTMEKAIDDLKKYWSESGQNECLKIKDEVYQHCQDASLNQLVDLWASQYDGPNGRKAGEKVDFNTPAFHQTFKRYLKGIIDFIMSSPKYEHDDYDLRKIKAVMYSVVTDKKNGALYPGGALYERIENHYRHGSGKGSPGGTMEKAQKAWSEYYDHGEKKGQQEALAIVDELYPFPSS